ncbi:MAG: glutamine--fructose-6-phosphate transaminase (isomerizing) [Clostridia bacterium]|nr:glutamine--fructose-6-phosphate transaminase (isomerizing) [Clostridia bacterium]
MCGIVGYIGEKKSTDVLLDGLSKLEYRGYDSAGVAVLSGDKMEIRKKKGRLKVLGDDLIKMPIEGGMGIGHTRWATHGAPSDENAHPHATASGDIAVVHNGIIENYMKLKDYLGTKGYTFVSQTDTEVIAHLIDHYYEGSLYEAVQEAMKRLEGSYALAVISKKDPDELIAVRKDSPLIIGLGEGENFIASDIPAILAYTRNVYLLNDDEVARVRKDGVDVFDKYGIPVQHDIFKVDWDVEAAEKGGYQHFMIKEIHEEPKALKDTLSPRITKEGEIDLKNLDISHRKIKNIQKIVIVACGTAYHAGLVAKYAFEEKLRIPVEIDIASEYRYRNPIVGPDDLYIIISQSGETADTMAAMRMAKKEGAQILAITNVVGSTLSREADYVMYTWAGPEIAVASTKAYTTQLLCLYLLMLEFGKVRGAIDELDYAAYITELKAIPAKAAEIITEDSIKQIMKSAHKHCTVEDTYFLGRNLDYAVALEGSLKLKEISYIHSEAFPAGELKHGPIALIEDNTLVITIATQERLFEKTVSNIKEVKARGAYVLAITTEKADLIRDLADEIILVPETMNIFMPILSVIPTQLFAYYCSVERGIDVDKPRNLAKSVTVE